MLSLVLNPDDGRPLVEQLVGGVKQHVEARLLRPGARLPSIRALAARLGVSRFTVIEAYDRLVASGHIESRRGSGFYVAAAATAETACDRTGVLERAVDVANLIAELDRLERTLYIGSFSKTLSSSMRVGFIAAAPQTIDALARMKLLTTITTSEFGERLVYEMLLGGHYRKHVSHIRDRLGARRARMASELERAGWEVYGPPDAGLFLWARHPDVDDSLWTAQGVRGEGLLLAAGASFRPLHEVSPWMRFNVACSADAAVYQVLARAPELARRAQADTRPSTVAPARAAA